jgi:hypothetical protein
MVNPAMVEGSMLEDLCIMMPKDKNQLLETIHRYYTQDFSREEIEKREKLLKKLYDNHTNALKIVELLK